jgi:hypothetical protein
MQRPASLIRAASEPCTESIIKRYQTPYGWITLCDASELDACIALVSCKITAFAPRSTSFDVLAFSPKNCSKSITIQDGACYCLRVLHSSPAHSYLVLRCRCVRAFLRGRNLAAGKVRTNHLISQPIFTRPSTDCVLPSSQCIIPSGHLTIRVTHSAQIILIANQRYTFLRVLPGRKDNAWQPHKCVPASCFRCLAHSIRLSRAAYEGMHV